MNWYNRQLKMARSRGVKKGWTTEELDRVKKLLEKGYNFNQIASLLDVNKNTIRFLNKKYKWKDLEVEKRKKDKTIADLYLLPPHGIGLSTSQIGKKYKFTYNRIRQALERLNLLDHLRDRSESTSLTYQNNPRLREEAAIFQKQRFLDNPGLKDDISRKQKQRYIDNPELREEQSIFMKERWKELGGMEGLLLSYPTREQAIRWLNGFVRRVYAADPRQSMAVRNTYMKIINNHTYPDEVQQGAIV